MPYVISPKILINSPGVWREGEAYTTETIYDLCSTDPKSPPVNYSAHTLRPHSICHFDSPSHIQINGLNIDDLIEKKPNIFFGPCAVLRLKKTDFRKHDVEQSTHENWEVSLAQLQEELVRVGHEKIGKLLLTFEGATENFYLDNRAFTLSHEAAMWLVTAQKIDLFGTIWRSTDYQPNSRERPIHNIFFESGTVLECLNLTGVPEGRYFISAFPLYLEGASEAPVCPVLYSPDELG